MRVSIESVNSFSWKHVLDEIRGNMPTLYKLSWLQQQVDASGHAMSHILRQMKRCPVTFQDSGLFLVNCCICCAPGSTRTYSSVMHYKYGAMEEDSLCCNASSIWAFPWEFEVHMGPLMP